MLVLSPVRSFAQDIAFYGTIRDSSGVVSGARVTLSLGGKELASVATDSRGTYRFERLVAGVYQVSVSVPGFERSVRTVTISSSSVPPVDFTLEVERVSTALTVTTSGGKATASRLPIPDDDLPAQVGSVSQELMQQQGVNSVAGALKNVSGVQAVRWYGAYEQYSIRGFFDDDRDAFNAVLVDGMRRSGNRYGTQTNNLQSIEVLKGPASVLYGRGAVGGVINLVRKKPDADASYDLAYQIGRFGAHQASFGATGRIANDERLLYRVDASVETTSGWRDAGSDRFNLSPTLTWIVNERARLTVQQDFNRDRFDGDGGVPLNITTEPAYRPEMRFSLPQDNVLVEDSQTQVLFNTAISPRWQFRNSLLVQRTSDHYFVTEGVYGDPDADLVYREPLDFHHIRRPLQNQAEVVGTINGFGRHTLLAGYEYQRDKYRTETTAGDDPECLCGYWWLTIPPMDINTMVETAEPLDLDTIERRTFVNDEVHAVYGQDQIDVLPRLKVNLGGRFDDYGRRVTREGGLPFTPQALDESNYSYRAGVVFEPKGQQQVYASASNSFTPVTEIPPDGSALDPSTARSYEVGYRWRGLQGRIDASLAAYDIVKNNLTVRESVTGFVQVGEQSSRGFDADVNADVGRGLTLVANYGVARPRFDDADDLTGKTPRFVPRYAGNIWLHKTWPSALTVAFGVRFVGSQFADNDNTTRLDGYTTVSAAIGYGTHRWHWSLNADNLLNKTDYFLPGHFGNLVFPGPPLNVTSTIRFNFR